MDFADRLVTSEVMESDGEQYSLRPRTLDEYIGQDKVKQNISVFIEAALKRNEALDHVLLFGPPGLGKTTLANIIANELHVNMRVTSGPAIMRQGDLAAILSTLSEGEVLFIDEIHRLPKAVEEILYSAMEDYQLDIVIGKGPGAQNVRLPLPKFTLIGATTRLGSLAAPLRDRFGVQCRLLLWSICLNLLTDLNRCKDADTGYIKVQAARLESLKPRPAHIINSDLTFKQKLKVMAAYSIGTGTVCRILGVKKYQ